MSADFIRWLNGLPYTTPESFEQAYREYLGPVEYPNREELEQLEHELEEAKAATK